MNLFSRCAPIDLEQTGNLRANAFGHFEGDQQTYRAKGELEDIRANKDCIRMFSERVIEAGVLTRGDLEAIDRDVISQIQESVAFAKAAPSPTAAELTTDVYVSY
mgnify:CR=1 FL=1